jgi:hypothetical protein
VAPGSRMCDRVSARSDCSAMVLLQSRDLADPATSARCFTRAGRRSVDSGAASMLGWLADDRQTPPYTLVARAG